MTDPKGKLTIKGKDDILSEYTVGEIKEAEYGYH